MQQDRVELAVSEITPATACAGERDEWVVTLGGVKLPPGSRVKLVLAGGVAQRGDWAQPQAEDPAGEGYVSAAVAGGGRPLAVRVPPWEESHGIAVEVSVGEEGLAAEEALEIRLGDRSEGGAGLRAQTFSQKRRPLPVLVDLGDSRSRPASPAPSLRITGGPADRVRLFLPSTVRPGEPFDGLIKVEDAFGNVARYYRGSVELAAEGAEAQLPEPLRTMTPQGRGLYAVPGLQAGEGPAVLRLRGQMHSPGDEVRSNPVRILGEDDEHHLYWGVLGGATELSDGIGSPSAYFAALRRDNALDFGAVGDALAPADAGLLAWRKLRRATKGANEPGVFVALPAYRWAPEGHAGDGARSVLHIDEDAPAHTASDDDCPRPWHLFRALHEDDGGRSLVIPRHTAAAAQPCDFSRHDPAHERLIEIHSARGCSERSVHDGNPYPPRPPGLHYGGEARGVPLDAGEEPAGFVGRALELGWRVGFIAGGDAAQGHPGDPTLTGPEPFRYRDGMVGVWAEALTREALWEGLYERRTVATTGPRIVLRWGVDEHPMGSDVHVLPGDEVAARRAVYVEVHGQERLAEVEILRNNEVVRSVRPKSADADLLWVDEAPLELAALRPRTSLPPFVFYYVRVIQADGEMAWASPVWFTLTAGRR